MTTLLLRRRSADQPRIHPFWSQTELASPTDLGGLQSTRTNLTVDELDPATSARRGFVDRYPGAPDGVFGCEKKFRREVDQCVCAHLDILSLSVVVLVI
jgi:hypothetical protein